MQTAVQFFIYNNNGQYTAESNFGIVTQGNSLAKLKRNIQDAFSLHFSDENMADFGLIDNPDIHYLNIRQC